MLGVDFLKALRQQSGDHWRLARATIIYHEMAHVFLMNRKIDLGPQGNEALADRMAGYCIGINRKVLNSESDIAITDQAIAQLAVIPAFAGSGDSVHGSPGVRIERLLEGYWQGLTGTDPDTALAALNHE